MESIIILSSLLGDCTDGVNQEINLGNHDWYDYILDISLESMMIESLDINITNSSLKIKGQEGQSIKKLSIKSISEVLYFGGIHIDLLEIYAPKPTKNTNLILNDVSKTIIRSFHQAFPELRIIKTYLSGVCFGHGTGDNVFGTSSTSISSINDLKETLPNAKWLNFFVSWIGSSTDAATLEIYPGVERTEDAKHWKIRSNSESIAKLTKYYSRTYYDIEVLESIAYAKSQGFLLCFTPSIFIEQVDKPWRGFITGSPSEVVDFYNRQYKPFILHYANLLRDLVDVFVLGSELKSLTSVHDVSYKNFTFIECLNDLAQHVKSILPNAKLTYCANWDEYHHTDEGYRPLDHLWSSPLIDMVGISEYSPITDKRNSNLSSNEVSEAIKNGEMLSFCRDSSGAQYPLADEWNVKNIEFWWSNNHFDPSGNKTSWHPKMKKIWLMEFGFPSLDKSTNAPNRYFLPEGSIDALPPHSTGHVSISHFIRAYAGFLNHYKDKEMIENMFAYLWEARGKDWHLKNYSDAKAWFYSHGLEGKINKDEEEYEIEKS